MLDQWEGDQQVITRLEMIKEYYVHTWNLIMKHYFVQLIHFDKTEIGRRDSLPRTKSPAVILSTVT